MNYRKIYFSLCHRARSRKIEEKLGYEDHHIRPKSLGGSNSSENRVLLTYREHYLAHLLLVKMSVSLEEKVKMAEALRWICKSNKGSRVVTSRMFETARRMRSKAQSEFQREIVGPNGETRAQVNARKLAKEKSIQMRYNWYHRIHGEETLSCYELSLKYANLRGKSSNLLKVAAKRRVICNGWILFENKDRDFTEERKKKMSQSAKKRTDKRRNQWSSKEVANT